LEPRSTRHSIKGRMLDTEGKGVTGIHLRLVVDHDGTNLACKARVDAHGNFEFENLEDELYSIHATDPSATYKFASLYAVPTNGEPAVLRLERQE
jgi:uncharacterized protein (DUF2249 family)